MLSKTDTEQAIRIDYRNMYVLILNKSLCKRSHYQSTNKIALLNDMRVNCEVGIDVGT